MAIVADIAAIGSAVMVVIFATWMVKQLMAGNNH